MADREFTEAEKAYFEKADIDNVMLLKEIKGLRAEINELKNRVPSESDEEKKRKILSIKNNSKRLKAIEENLDLFRK